MLAAEHPSKSNNPPQANRREQRKKRIERRERRRQEQARNDEKTASLRVHDPLEVVRPDGTPASLEGLWRGSAGFLVCGGPSANEIANLPAVLRERGIVSLGVNNVAGHLPVRAWTFSDPPEKFHHGLFFDPSLIKLVPIPKLKRGQVRIKFPDGWFKLTGRKVREFPNVWGYKRIADFRAKDFLTSDAATWGNNDEGVQRTGGEKCLCTMLLGLRLMHYLGCRRVYLVGADFRMKPGAGYSFNQERTAGAAGGNNNIYRVANKFLCDTRPFLDAAGFRVYNVNPHSALEAFDHVPFEQAYLDCKGVVPQEPFDLSGFYEFKGEGRGEREKD